MIRLIGYFFGIGTVFALMGAAAVAFYVGSVSQDLPDYEVLASYEPPVTTRVHAASGELMAEYAKERRLFLPIQAIPDRVKAAFLSAEDKNFYSHPGVDVTGLARAIVTNVQNLGSGRRPVGASTITQQVAKNFLLSADQTIDRKVREAILSFRIEQAYSKDRILELYLNEIFFGMNAYGIAGAALTYFDKSVNELTIAETAYLAALPKAPSNYHPFRETERAVERRDWVVDRMLDNGYITDEEAREAKSQPLEVTPRQTGSYLFASEYFSEEVRRQIIERYGNDTLYEGGLSVRTTLNPAMQAEAREALHRGLISYDERRGYRGAIDAVDIADDWGAAISAVQPLRDVPEWRVAVVLAVDGEGATIGLRPDNTVSGQVGEARETATIAAADMEWAYRLNSEGNRSTASSPTGVLSVGDAVYVENIAPEGETARYRLRQPPGVQGALVAMDPHTGRVLAMVGGFSFAQSEFNRATQAMRQPGSAFKPFVYAAALDNGYSPASVVLDAPIEVAAGGEIWRPKNYGGEAAGPSTLRAGIERSRNLMTVRLAQDMGMDLVAEYSERFGIYDNLLPYLPMSLGAGETTVLRMVSAYSVIANGGKQIKPSLIDRIQDRYGRTIFRHEERVCETCQANEWQAQEEPIIADNRDQVLDPMTAYQMTSMLEGVVTRGTAASAVNLGRPTAGKTGTTNEEKDAWFVGYTPDLVTAVFMGFDNPTPMGRGSTGGGLAAPIFNEFMNAVLEGTPPADFRVPEGITLMAIDRTTGMSSGGSGGNVIMEAFKPGTGPSNDYVVIGMDNFVSSQEIIEASPQASRAINTGGGGLY
jgi:penicillin-binding protein 1A